MKGATRTKKKTDSNTTNNSKDEDFAILRAYKNKLREIVDIMNNNKINEKGGELVLKLMKDYDMYVSIYNKTEKIIIEKYGQNELNNNISLLDAGIIEEMHDKQ